MLKWECQLFHSPCHPASRCGCLPGMAQYLPRSFAGCSKPSLWAAQEMFLPALNSCYDKQAEQQSACWQAWGTPGMAGKELLSTWLCSSSATTGLPQLRQKTIHARLWCVVLFHFCVCNKINLNKKSRCFKIILFFNVLHFFQCRDLLVIDI